MSVKRLTTIWCITIVCYFWKLRIHKKDSDFFVMETVTCFLSHDAVAKQDIYIVAVLSVFSVLSALHLYTCKPGQNGSTYDHAFSPLVATPF